MPRTGAPPRWIFGYGSLIWRPGFEPLETRAAVAEGYARRFWQASHDHRGRPGAPGRVVTLAALDGERCEGVALRLPHDGCEAIFTALDERERDGYRRERLELTTPAGERLDAVTWLAAPGNSSWVGPAGDSRAATVIAGASGASGANRDYLFSLADCLRERAIADAHVEALARSVRALIDAVPGNVR